MTSAPIPPSLCATCKFARFVTSAKGSTFTLCNLAKTDQRFSKYPPQPQLRCAGHAV